MKYKNYTTWNFNTIKEMLSRVVDEHGDVTAFKFKVGKEICQKTYTEFRNDTMHLGTALYDLGFASKHIAMIGENSYDWLKVYLTVLQSDGVFVPVDKELPISDIIEVINDSDSEVVFYSNKFDKLFRENQEKFTNIKYFIGIDNEADDGKFLSYEKLIQIGEQLYKDGNTGFSSITSDPEKMKVLVYTSGTTGRAKGVMLSEKNICSCVYYGLQVSNVYTTCLSVLPYNHTYEAIPGILVAIHEHCTICINESLKAILKNLKLYKPDYIYLVPAFADMFYKKIWSNAEKSGKAGMMRKMIKVSNALRKVHIDLRRVFFKEIHEVFGGNLIQIVCGGAPIRAEVGDFFDAIGITLFNGYGITECSPLVSVNDVIDNDCTTVGHIMPCLEMKFENVDEEGNGEICVKGDTVMLGYYKHPDLTAEAIKDGWFNTGDYGRLNKNGLIVITGRKKNLIILSNGKNIFPEEIEDYITSIPYVSEAVVYAAKNDAGMEDELWTQVFLNEEVVAEMDIDDVQKRLTADINAVLTVLPAYKHISKIIIRDHEFEKTTTKKIKRNSIDK